MDSLLLVFLPSEDEFVVEELDPSPPEIVVVVLTFEELSSSLFVPLLVFFEVPLLDPLVS
jgi:hypothetical protein